MKYINLKKNFVSQEIKNKTKNRFNNEFTKSHFTACNYSTSEQQQ